MGQVKIFKCIVHWYKQFIDKIIYIERFEIMNKYLLAIILSILSITSQAAAWIQTEICNTTGRDITLYKPTYSSDKPSYVNKDGSTGWFMYEGIVDSDTKEPKAIKSVPIPPNTDDCINKTTKITVWDSYWGGDRDYMTLCDRYDDCKNGTYSLQFYNDSGAMEVGVVPGYAYYYNRDNISPDICKENGKPCALFKNYVSTACRYISTINKNDGNLGIDYIYNCSVVFF